MKHTQGVFKMGFLNSSDTVIDMILTNEGEKQLAAGNLNFSYYVFFDDEVDYDPYVHNSASLNDMFVTSSKLQQIENGLVREAVSGYARINPKSLDRTNLYRPIFTAPQGQKIIPKVLKLHRTDEQSIVTNQQKIVESSNEWKNSIDRGFNKFGSTESNYGYGYTPNSFPQEYSLDGFKVKVFSSSSDGTIEIIPKFDLSDAISFKSNLKIKNTGNLPRGIKTK